MNKIDDIKSRVEKLTPEQKNRLLLWMFDRHHADWDSQIAHDLAAGKLDDLIAEAERDLANGHGRAL